MLQITGEILTASVIANLVTIALAIFVALIKSVEAPVVTKQYESIHVHVCTCSYMYHCH